MLSISEYIHAAEAQVRQHALNVRITQEINDSPERVAMGLPAHLIDIYSDALLAIHRRQQTVSTQVLAKQLESTNSHFLERLCAAQTLDTCGVGRVNDLPDFLPVPSGRALIGTHVSHVDALLEDVEKLGVKRPWIVKETPQYSTDIAKFLLSVYPVTNRQYRRFLLETYYPEFPSSWLRGVYPVHFAEHPVHTVTTDAISAYCAWLSQKISEPVRLPSEQEWEYAANGGKPSQYTWGDTFELFYANTNEVLLQRTTPVGIFSESRSPFGMQDMIGNVEEFVSSHYEPYPGGIWVEDDLYKKLGRYQIAKGGAYNRFRDLARIQRRHGAYPSSLYAIGFRVAISA
jgi:formylglycine-generating enzyme required for sulfatase activity